MPPVTANGIRIHVEDSGQGPPVVFVHAYLGNADVWAGQRLALTGRYRVITYDARGHGRSDVPGDPGAYGPRASADDLVGVLDALGVPAAYLCGLSMGAETVLDVLLQRPDRVLGAVLADYGTGLDDPAAFGASGEELARAFLERGTAWTFENYLVHSDLVVGLGARRRRALEGMRRLVVSQSPVGMAHALRAVVAGRSDLRAREPELGRVDRPVLVIRGALDRSVARPSAFLVERIPGVEEVVIPGVGHVTNIQAPGEFNRALAGFLDRCVRARSEIASTRQESGP